MSSGLPIASSAVKDYKVYGGYTLAGILAVIHRELHYSYTSNRGWNCPAFRLLLKRLSSPPFLLTYVCSTAAHTWHPPPSNSDSLHSLLHRALNLSLVLSAMKNLPLMRHHPFCRDHFLWCKMGLSPWLSLNHAELTYSLLTDGRQQKQLRLASLTIYVLPSS